MNSNSKKSKVDFKKKSFHKYDKKNQRRGRLIIRNLPFKATDDNLREHFARFGEIVDINLLRKPDGKLVGCAFVEFKIVQNAAKAIFHCTGKEFLGRPIVCDWAVSKDKYLEATQPKVKDEKPDVGEIEIKEEPMDEDDVERKDVEIKSENEQSDSEEVNNSIDKEQDDSDDDDVKEEAGDDSEEDEDIKEEVESDSDTDSKKPYVSNDIKEGKTVFVKNVPFSATNEDLKKVMLQFGRVYYALICMDPFTEHSKGTAFVKFVNQEDTEKCLQAGTELKLLGNILDCHRAMGRNEINNKNTEKPKEKDKRNLYLIKEGVILAGSKSAEGVSASDMAKRLQLEQHKTQMLRNLNMFISRVRLIIHNLPPSWDDHKLRILFKKYAGPKAVIREAKVMRDLKNVDGKGIGKSKEFGFVAFEKHEDALNALRALNNNPTIFSKTKRPIVGFSIENRVMINARQKRLQKSKQKNPKCIDYDPEIVSKERNEQKEHEGDDDEELKEFSGTVGKPGSKKMRTKFSLKKQAELHHRKLKDEKRKSKFSKKTLAEKKQDFIRQPQQKQNKISKKNKRLEDDNFSKIVENYKKKLISVPVNKKSKWYEQ